MPGQRLVEQDLTKALDVSRGPVREALRRLDALGIVRREPHRGAGITQFTRREAVDMMRAVVSIGGSIAKFAAVAVASKTTPGNMVSVKRALKPFINKEEDPNDLLTQRREFYDTLMAIGGNTQIPMILPVMRIHLLRMQTFSYLDKKDRTQHIEEYAAIANAVLHGNPALSEKLAINHLERIAEAIERLPDVAFQREA